MLLLTHERDVTTDPKYIMLTCLSSKTWHENLVFEVALVEEISLLFNF